MRVMALDYGTRRTGVAVCDELEITVRPVETVRAHSRQAVIDRVIWLVQELDAARIVVGLPLNMDGSRGPAAERAEEFVRRLEAQLVVPVELYDERLTSYAAEQLLRERGLNWAERKAQSDAWAAVVLLEDYLSARGRAPG